MNGLVVVAAQPSYCCAGGQGAAADRQLLDGRRDGERDGRGDDARPAAEHGPDHEHDERRRGRVDAHARPSARVEGQGRRRPQADHLIPPGLQMGASLPLIAPVREEAPAASPMPYQQPKGRMLIYWGCGEHVSAGQPTIIDFAKMAPGKVPPGMAAMASMAHVVSGPFERAGLRPLAQRPRQPPGPGDRIAAWRAQGRRPIIRRRSASALPPARTSCPAWVARSRHPAVGRGPADVAPGGAGHRLCAGDVRHATRAATSSCGVRPSAQMAAIDYLAPAEVKRLVTPARCFRRAPANACSRPKSRRRRRRAW